MHRAVAACAPPRRNPRSGRVEYRWVEETDRSDDVTSHHTTQRESNMPVSDQPIVTPAPKAAAESIVTPPKEWWGVRSGEV